MLDVFDPQNRELLEGIQGNILKSHGRHHTANIFIRCNDGKQTEAKAWLKNLVEGEGPIVKSAFEQLLSTELWKKNRNDTGLFGCIHISAAGYDYLFGVNSKNYFNDTAFTNGMSKAILNDPPVEKWEAGLSGSHFILLLANTYPEALFASIVEVEKTVIAFANITTIERGDALFNPHGAGIEHFGYVDGISQPLFFTDEWETYKTDNMIKPDSDIKFDPRAEKELVLTPDPFAKNDPSAFGSYFVFRKLEQNVKGFKQAEAMLAFQLGLQGDDKERAGAMLVGRFEDGTPVETSGKDGYPNSAHFNDFDYTINDNSRCPFHAHIRKTNPRSDLAGGGMTESKKHTMARRGIPFGIRIDDPFDGQIVNKPEDKVGLLFMSYQSSIMDQFEFIQKNWANNPTSLHQDPTNPDGMDPIIGQGGANYPTLWGVKDPKAMKNAGFGQYVNMKGGEYFFAPSMSFLKNIDQILIS